MGFTLEVGEEFDSDTTSEVNFCRRAKDLLPPFLFLEFKES